jgi:hypothetical protein
MHLAQLVNAALGYIAVTPWTLDRMPADDLNEILYMLDLRQQLVEMDKEKAERERKRKERELKRKSK